MNKNELLNKILNEKNPDVLKTIDELETLLDKEISKNTSQLDCELINELSLGIIEANGDKSIEVDLDRNFEEFNNKYLVKNKPNIVHHRIKKWAVGLAVAVISVSTFAMVPIDAKNNFFNFMFSKKSGAISNFPEEEERDIQHIDTCTYPDLESFLANNQDFPMPEYIPKGYEFFSADICENYYEKDVCLSLYNGVNPITINKITCFQEDPSAIKYQADGSTIESYSCNGINYDIYTNIETFFAISTDELNKTIYSVHTLEGLDELKKILNSIYF